MFTRTRISVALAVAAMAWGLVLYLQGSSLTWEHLAPFSTVVAVLAAIAVLMEHFLWRVRILQGWLFERPDLRGTWAVTINSEWIDPQTNERVPPISAYAAITQTMTKLEIHLMTPESESCVVAHAITPTDCGNRFNISVVYANTPDVELRGVRSERHVGAAMITTHGSKKYKPESMSAEYWTDRRSVGRMSFEKRKPTIYSRYQDAAAAFQIAS